MHLETVEIYSDTSNAAVMRHPARRFPGLLLQGDTLYSMCQSADSICSNARSRIDGDAYDELNDLRNRLRSLLNHYKIALGEHEIPLPFGEQPLG